MGEAPTDIEVRGRKRVFSGFPADRDNKTIGVRKGYFSGRFGLPFFQAHRYMSLSRPLKEKKHKKMRTVRINSRTVGVC
jgi:hypothetical protein